MQIIPTCASVIEFLSDEGFYINPKVRRNSETDYSISINEIFVSDTKRRLTISTKIIENRKFVIFNGFKSSALMGDDYHGSFFKLVKLIKGFNSTKAAKLYFFNSYLVKYLSLSDITLSDEDEYYQPEPQVKLEFPSHFEKLDLFKTEHQPYVNYFNERFVSLKRLEQLKLYIDNATKRIIFPVYENNELVFYTGRSIKPHPLRWLKADVEDVFPIWNFENVNGETIFIFEGIFDAIHFSNGVALLGAYWNETLRDAIMSKKFHKIVIFLDNDAPGIATKTRIAENLISEGLDNVYIYNYSGLKQKDFSELKQKGIDFESWRVVKYNYETKIKMKMGLIK